MAKNQQLREIISKYRPTPQSAGGVYSNTEIREAVRSKHILIHPLVEAHLGGSSYDVTLGEWYFLTEKTDRRDTYNPFDWPEVKRYFGKPLKATRHAAWCKRHDRSLFKNIPPQHPIIVLRPGERILAHTHEFIGILPPGTTEMRARSSWGRNGIAACFDAGWGDPGYINRWTMEIYNLNEHESVPLPVGERIAQIVFHHTGPVKSDYGSRGKYQSGIELKRLIKTWKPVQMLPQAYKDKRHQPLPL